MAHESGYLCSYRQQTARRRCSSAQSLGDIVINSKAGLTKAQIAKLCRHHKLPYQDSCRIEVGFTNEIHTINSNLILKVYLDSQIKYQTEVAILKTKTNFSKPKLICYGEPNQFIGHNYIFMSLIEGLPLGHVWHKLTPNQRQSLIKDYISALRQINQLPADILPPAAGDNWYQIIRDDISNDAKILVVAGTISAHQQQRSLEVVDRLATILAQSPLQPVYRDIHLDNLLVDSDSKLKGLIDFEQVRLAALDYPSFILKRLVDEPHIYATEANEKLVKLVEYKPLWGWYQELYPEMFAFDNFEERLRIYQLSNCLRLLINHSHVDSIMDDFKRLLASV